MSGIYVHIPFCKSRCIYCGFYSSTLHELQHRYVDALISELHIRSDYISSPVRTIYIGGGTPSILNPEELFRLIRELEKFAEEKNGGKQKIEEFTVECNPDDISSADSKVLEVLSHTSVNRVSMGAQTFSDERLAFLRRRHKASDVVSAINNLRSIGIKNVSIDLMFGFPKQSIVEWESGIEKVLNLCPEHISAYSLMYEEGTPLYHLLKQGKVEEVDEEVSRQMYELLIDKLSECGYEHYEISNFARPGMHSRHNSSYWQAIPYLGIGAAAHSYNGTSRQWNVDDVEKYCKVFESVTPTMKDTMHSVYASANEKSDSLLGVLYEKETLDDTTRYNDLITTAMRTREGIAIENFSLRYNLPQSYLEHLLHSAEPLIADGLLSKTDVSICLTRKGLFVSDSVMCELIY